MTCPGCTPPLGLWQVGWDSVQRKLERLIDNDFLFHLFCFCYCDTSFIFQPPLWMDLSLFDLQLYISVTNTHTAECQLTCFHSPCRPHLFELHALLLLGCVFPRLQLIGSSLSLRDLSLSLSLRVWRWIGLFMLASDRVRQ